MLQDRCCVVLCCRAGVVLCCVAGQVLCCVAGQVLCCDAFTRGADRNEGISDPEIS